MAPKFMARKQFLSEQATAHEPAVVVRPDGDGRAQRRRRFRTRLTLPSQSGVALCLPPHSKWSPVIGRFRGALREFLIRSVLFAG